MKEYIRKGSTSLAMVAAALFSLAACGDKTANNDAMAGDSALGRDLAMARDSASQPQLQDVPAPAPAPEPVVTPPARPQTTTPRPTPKPAPARVTPAPTPAPPPAAVPAPAEPVTGTVAAGTTMEFASNSTVCSNTKSVGDRFTASLADRVQGSNGIDIPSGATGTFEVTSARSAKNSGDSSSLGVKLLSVTYAGHTYPVESTVQSASTLRVRSASKGDDAKKVAGGAIIGAIAGQIIGKNTKGTVIGAAAGAAAGTAAAAATADYDTCLNNGAVVTVRLDAPAKIRGAATP